MLHEGDTERLRDIVKAFRSCGAEPTEADVARQFRYETGRAPDGAALERALRARVSS